MQFDELATNQLHETYSSKFAKIQTLERRNPLKYMKNPESVFGTTLGAKQYTWKEHDSRNAKSIGKRNNSMYK